MNETGFVETHGEGELKAVENKEAEQNIEKQEELPELSDIEQKAYDQGWRPKDDFEGPEGNWKSANQYVSDGEWLGKIKDLNQKMDAQARDFDDRLENVNKLNDARRDAEITALKKTQREAVEVADSAAYDDAQSKIEDLEKQADVAPVVPGKDPDIAAWESKNTWINEAGNEKAVVANGIWSTYTTQNPAATVQQALAHVDERIDKLYPSSTPNPRRDAPNTSENSTRKPQNKNKDLTMGDLTQSEQSEWNQHGQMMFKTEKAFLKAVKDARKK